MFEYIIILVLGLLGFTTLGKTRQYKYVLIGMMCAVIAFRGMSVGTDVYGYSMNFNRMTANPSSWQTYIMFDPGFGWLVYVFKEYISDNPLDCWGLMGIIYVLSFCFFAKKYTDVTIAVLLFLLYGSYFIGFNIIRQCFALSVVLLIFTRIDITRQRTLKQRCQIALVLMITGYLFHPALCIMAIVPFFNLTIVERLSQKKIHMAIILISFVISVTELSIQYITAFLDSTGVEGKVISYMTRIYSQESGYSVLKLTLISSFHLFAIWVSRNTKNIFLMTGTFAIAFLCIFGQIVIEFVRIYESLMVLGLVYYAQLYINGPFKTTKPYYKPVLIIYCVVLYLNFIIKGYGEITPYVYR